MIHKATCAALVLTASVFGQDDDPVAEKLAEAKRAYTLIIDRSDTTIDAALQQAETQAGIKGSQAALQLVKLQRQRFEEFGCTPTLCPSSFALKRISASQNLLKAYQLAATNYSKGGKEGELVALQFELQKHWPPFMSDAEYGGLPPFWASSY